MSKFKIGDNVKAIKECDGDKEFIGKIGTIIGVDCRDTTLPYEVRFKEVCDYWCEEESLKLVEEESKYEPRYDQTTNELIIPDKFARQKISELEAKLLPEIPIGDLYGYKVVLKQFKDRYTIGVDFAQEYPCYPIYQTKENKQTIMSKITTFAKNLVLSADEKLLRKYGLHDECGNHTDEAEELVIAKLVKENESYLVELATAMQAEEAKK